MNKLQELKKTFGRIAVLDSHPEGRYHVNISIEEARMVLEFIEMVPAILKAMKNEGWGCGGEYKNLLCDELEQLLNR